MTKQDENIKENLQSPDVETVDETIENNSEEKVVEQMDEDSSALQTELAEMKDKYLRLFAEFENYKRRTAKEIVDMRMTASKELIKELLPVWDDFERALSAAGEEQEQDQAFREGIQLVYNKFINTLKSKGVEPYDKAVLDFDPELHAAIAEVPAPSEELQGKIIDYVNNGYMLNGKVLRHAEVVIGK